MSANLAAGDGLEPALKRGTHLAWFFDFFAIAVERPRDGGIVRTRIDRDADEVLVLHGKAIGEETGHAGLLRVIAVVVIEHDHDRQLVLLANSQSRQSWIIVERAVANQTENGPFGKGCFDS